MAIIAAGRKITLGTILRPFAALLAGVVVALLLGELPLTPDPGTTRVLFLGDSVTFGAGVLAEEACPRLLESALNAGDAARVKTVTAGVIGYNTLQELGRFEDVGLAYRPTLVVHTFVVNDLLESFSNFDHLYVPSPPFAAQKVWLLDLLHERAGAR